MLPALLANWARRLTAPVLIVLFLTGCPQDLTVNLVAGSTTRDLRFAMSNRVGRASSGELHRFAVLEWGGDDGPAVTTTLWEIEYTGRGTPRVDTVRYGSAPEGFATVVAAKALHARGRFVAVGGSAGVEFRVAPDGAVTEFAAAQQADRFVAAGMRTDQVSPFLERLRAAVASGEPQQLADLMHFPLRASDPDSTWLVEDRAAFIGAVDALLPVDLLERIRAVEVGDLIVTAKGAALAEGRLWIGTSCAERGRTRCRPAVVELNRYRTAPP